MKICCIAFYSIHTKKYIEWLIKRGHQVYWLTHQPNNEIEGVRVVDIGFKRSVGNRLKRYLTFDLNNNFSRHLRLFLKVRKIIKDIKPDILHLHTLYFPSYAGVFAGFRPMIITPWDGDILWTKPRPLYYRNFVRYALKKADAITSDNQMMRESCIKYGVREDKIKVTLWFGADTSIFKPQPEDQHLKKELALDDGPVVLSTRSISAEYNIDTIVRSIPLVLRKIPKAKFIFIWYSGNKVEEIKNMVSQLGIKDSVFFLGKLDNYFDIPRYYSISQVALSIASPDSTPASLLEAMACGVAPIVSNEPTITEFIKDNWNGIVVSPRDHKMLAEAIVRLINNPNQRQLFTERNLKLVREIGDYDKNMKEIEDLYYKLIKKKNKRCIIC